MRKNIFLLLIVLFFQAASFGQNSNLQQLIDSATSSSGLFVSAKPLAHFGLNEGDTSEYQEYLKEVSGTVVSTQTFVELVANSENVDTTNWTDDELKNFILIKPGDDFVYKKDVFKKFHVTDKKQEKYYRKIVSDFNYTSSWDKNIYFFSKPVFDDTKQFAIVRYDNGHSGLAGGGSVTLYHFENNAWRKIGNIETWVY